MNSDALGVKFTPCTCGCCGVKSIVPFTSCACVCLGAKSCQVFILTDEAQQAGEGAMVVNLVHVFFHLHGGVRG